MVIGFAGAKGCGAGKFRMVGGVRVQLGLHGESHAASCEELETGLVVEYLKETAGSRGIDGSHDLNLAGSGMVQAEVLVVAADHPVRDGSGLGAGAEGTAPGRRGDLPVAEFDRRTEIIRSTLHGQKFSRRDKAIIDLGNGIGIYADDVVQDVFRRESVEIEIDVMRQVADRRFIGRRPVFDRDTVVISDGESEECLKGPGESIQAVL